MAILTEIRNLSGNSRGLTVNSHFLDVDQRVILVMILRPLSDHVFAITNLTKPSMIFCKSSRYQPSLSVDQSLPASEYARCERLGQGRHGREFALSGVA